MGRLTETVFSESCCDGGECTPGAESAKACGCDPGAHWVCAVHSALQQEQEQGGVVNERQVKLQARQFPSGATRDTDDNKPDYEAFISPLVTKRYGQYMLKHRVQPDGKLREGDNWQKGMTRDAYIKSLVRHTEDLRLHHDGFGDQAVETLEDSLCAILFNTSGYLFELLRQHSERAK